LLLPWQLQVDKDQQHAKLTSHNQLHSIESRITLTNISSFPFKRHSVKMMVSDISNYILITMESLRDLVEPYQPHHPKRRLQCIQGNPTRYSTRLLLRISLNLQSPDQVQEMRALFNMLDKDGDGIINKSDLSLMLDSLGTPYKHSPLTFRTRQLTPFSQNNVFSHSFGC
jgi:hypothetical protein